MALLPYAHALDALLPALDHLARAQPELQPVIKNGLQQRREPSPTQSQPQAPLVLPVALGKKPSQGGGMMLVHQFGGGGDAFQGWYGTPHGFYAPVGSTRVF